MRNNISQLCRLHLMMFVGMMMLVLTTGNSYAVPVYGTEAALSGTRTVGDGLSGTGNFAASNVSLSWDIATNLDGTFTYSYIVAGFQGIRGGGISHFTLDLSDNYDHTTVMNATLNGYSLGENVEFGNFNEPAQSGPYLITGGVKFDAGSDFVLEHGGSVANGLVYSFVSTRIPVWATAFVKGGGGLDPGNHAYTNGITNIASGSTNDFIAAPDSVSTPEPGTMLLFGAGLLGLGASRKKMK